MNLVETANVTIYYAFSGKYDVVLSIIFGELVYRSEPFSDSLRVTLITAVGISSLIIVAAVYQIFKERDMKNILAINYSERHLRWKNKKSLSAILIVCSPSSNIYRYICYLKSKPVKLTKGILCTKTIKFRS
jgi:hypothetical protein